MADHNTHTDHTYVRETRTGGGGATLAFIVGGLVALVAVIAFFVWGGDIDNGTRSATGGGDVSVSVEAGAGAEADGDAEAVAPPAGESAAPAEEAPAPAPAE